jgi:hypothetical protein
MNEVANALYVRVTSGVEEVTTLEGQSLVPQLVCVRHPVGWVIIVVWLGNTVVHANVGGRRAGPLAFLIGIHPLFLALWGRGRPAGSALAFLLV